MAYRSAKTGRYVKASTAARNPRATVRTQSGKSKSAGSRSAISGRYVSRATARRHPGTTIQEGR